MITAAGVGGRGGGLLAGALARVRDRLGAEPAPAAPTPTAPATAAPTPTAQTPTAPAPAAIPAVRHRLRPLLVDASFGLANGVEYVLWCYAFATMIFTGILAPYLPLAASVILVGCATVIVSVALTSRVPNQIAGTEEQAVAILATVGALMNARIGEFSGPGGAAVTMFAIMGLSTMLFGASLFLAGRFNLHQLVQLMPYPVVCGYLAGVGWLFFSAAVGMLGGVEPEVLSPASALAPATLWRWLPALACGWILFALLQRRRSSLLLPGALIAVLAAFYLVAAWQGASLPELREGGWLFHLDRVADGAGPPRLDVRNVNLPFLLSVVPEIGTLLLLCLLTGFFAFSGLEVGLGRPLDLPHELRSHATANVLGGLVFGLPGFTDPATTTMAERLGARTRLLPLLTGAVCVIVALAGGSAIEYLPKIAIGMLVFMMAVHFFHDWLLAACRQMSRADTIVVWTIFAVIAVVGFIQGVVVGVVLASALFIVQYAKLGALTGTQTLRQLRSSVDRETWETEMLDRLGDGVVVFNVQGFLFFGTANILFEHVKRSLGERGRSSHYVFNLKRVRGIDATGAQIFARIIKLLDGHAVEPLFSGLSERTLEAFRVAGVFEERAGPVLSDLDSALRRVEDELIEAHAPRRVRRTIQDIMTDILGDAAKAERLIRTMTRLQLEPGSHLFRQNDAGTDLYVIESGSIEIRLEEPGRPPTRLREFRRGGVVGEMATYSDQKRRSASAVVLERAVVFRLNPERIRSVADRAAELTLHEFIARLLAARVRYWSGRIQMDG